MLRVAYCGSPPLPTEWLFRWNLDPWLLAALSLGTVVLWRQAGRERQPLVAGAVLILLLVFVSPLCALSSALFAARIVHHVLLVACAAPLLALAVPPHREQGAALPLAVSTITLWLWHVPAFYTAALQHVGLYWFMQLTLLATAVWFWRAVVSASAELPTALVTVAAAIGQMGMLGALLTFAPQPLYPHHLVAPLSFGIDPLQDQQLAGLIMWVPAMLPYGVVAAWISRKAWSSGWARNPA